MCIEERWALQNAHKSLPDHEDRDEDPEQPEPEDVEAWMPDRVDLETPVVYPLWRMPAPVHRRRRSPAPWRPFVVAPFVCPPPFVPVVVVPVVPLPVVVEAPLLVVPVLVDPFVVVPVPPVRIGADRRCGPDRADSEYTGDRALGDQSLEVHL